MKLDFSKTYRLENEKVKLLPLEISHATALAKIANDYTIWRYFFEKAYDLESMITYVSNAIAERNEGKSYPFVIYDKQTQNYVGCTRLYDYSKDLRVIRLGHTWLGKDFQGTGINKNVKYLVFQFIFETLNLERIGLGASADNLQSIAAMKSVGCKKEGVFRAIFPALNGEGRTDAILMSILKSEWQNTIKQQLEHKLK